MRGPLRIRTTGANNSKTSCKADLAAVMERAGHDVCTVQSEKQPDNSFDSEYGSVQVAGA